MAEKTAPPCWGYKIENGEVISKLFNEGGRPRGWKDTPAGMQEEIDAKKGASD